MQFTNELQASLKDILFPFGILRTPQRSVHQRAEFRQVGDSGYATNHSIFYCRKFMYNRNRKIGSNARRWLVTGKK